MQIATLVAMGLFVGSVGAAPVQAATLPQVEWSSKVNEWDLASATQLRDGGHVGVLGEYLYKLDSNGQKLWQQAVTGNVQLNAVIAAADGGFVVAGSIEWTNGPMGYVAKYDAQGRQLWERPLVLTQLDYALAQSVQPTQDGGWIVAGQSFDWTNMEDGESIWLWKLDSAGHVQWANDIGGDSLGVSDQSVRQTATGGYVVAGSEFRRGPTGERLERDALLIQTDAAGQAIAKRAFGGADSHEAQSVTLTTDGGYLVVGSYGRTGQMNFDGVVAKYDASLQKLWERSYGSLMYDRLNVALALPNGGALVAGGFETSMFNPDWRILQLDANGVVTAEYSVPQAGLDDIRSLYRTQSGKIAVAGSQAGGRIAVLNF